MDAKNLTPVWMSLDKREKQTVLADLIVGLEQVAQNDRLEAAKVALYILQVRRF